MRHVLYSARARADIGEIWVHIAIDGGDALANQIIDRIEQRAASLAHHPHLGPARPEIGAAARALLIERWLVLYRVEDPQVQIMRVVDGARDLRNVSLAPEK